MTGTEECHPELALNVTKPATGCKTALHLTSSQDCVQTVNRPDTGKLITLIFQDKVGPSTKVLFLRKVCWNFQARQFKTDVVLGPLPSTTTEEPRAIVQAAAKSLSFLTDLGPTGLFT